jgi:MFS family permease
MENRKRSSGFFTFSRFETGIWIMIIIRFLGFFSFAVSGPYFMLYLSRDRGLTLTLAGMLVAFSGLGSAFSQVLGGVFTDRFGRRRTILLFYGLGTLINIVLTVMIAASTTMWLFASVYIISGLVWGMTQPAVTAVITDLAPREKLTEAFGLAQIVANVGWIFGPLLGGYMYGHYSFTYIMAITIVTNAFSFLLALTTLHDSFTGSKVKTDWRNTFSFKGDTAILSCLILNMLVFVVYPQITNTYSVFTVDRLGFTTTQYGLLMTINAVILVVLQHPVTRLVDVRLGDKNALVWGSILFGAGFLSFSWITGFGWSVAAIVIFTAGEMLFVPSATSIVGKLAGAEQRGRYMGILGTSTGIGIAIGPLMGGALLDASGNVPLVMWGPTAAITFIAAIGYLRWFSVYKKRLQ